MVGKLNIQFSAKDRSSRQKIDTETLDLNYILDQVDLAEIYRVFHPKAAEDTFLSTHGTFSRIDCMLGHKTRLSNFKETEIIPSTFSNHNGMKLEINKKRKT